MSRVLVALDESRASQRVVEFVNRFFPRLDMEILAISVAHSSTTWIPPATGWGFVYSWGWPAAATADELAHVEQDLVSHASTTVAASDVQADETIVEIGDPTAAILRAAQDREVDLIVVGSNHKNFLERIVSRSISREVLDASDLPVLVVP